VKLNEKILTLRKKQGLSQEELAEKLNVSRQAVSRWEVGSAQPDASNILQLSKLFGVTADYLLNDEYESDRDVPIVRRTERRSKENLQKIAGICLGAFGLLGNFVMYIISRLVPVMVPIVIWENGKRMYHWNSTHTDYSYRYFVKEYNLEFLTILFWLLLAVGLMLLFVKPNIKE
jgi:transcriptional regulator with XRE-family HTH domain